MIRAELRITVNDQVVIVDRIHSDLTGRRPWTLVGAALVRMVREAELRHKLSESS